MIPLRNGHVLEYVAASGALAFDGRGWPWEWPLRWLGLLDPRCFTIVTKSLTRRPRVGNLRWWQPWRCVRLLPHGTVNAIGLTNPGIEWWCRTIGPRVAKFPYRLIGSIYPESPGECADMVAMLQPFGLVAIEVNLSCPNTSTHGSAAVPQAVEMLTAARSATPWPLIAKLSVTHDYCAIARASEGLIDAMAINSVPWSVSFPDRPSPLATLGGGGVSGQAAQLHTWPMVEKLAAASHTPVIGPSVWEYADIAQLRARGASAISFGSIFLRYPWRPTAFVRCDQRDRIPG
ncbi:MAG: hypothetical protein HY696_10415 [Deltaproteobacteria bacterium]|nr:hypothetical protein [Deltaproteobacteria bacterium]